MESRSERASPVPPTAPPAPLLPDGWYDVFRWLHHVVPAAEAAEQLTVEVCRRLRSGGPAWLADRDVDVQQRFFVAQVVLEHRGVLSAGVRRSTAPRAGRTPQPAAPGTLLALASTPEGPDRGSPGGNDERRDQVAGATVARILASLVAGGPSGSWPAQLVEDCRLATQMSGVGLAVMGPDGPATVLAATEGHAQQMEDLQFSLGEGPCVDASRSGRPVLITDLTAQASGRWPAFTPEATGAGVHAAFTFPLQVGAIGIGVLDLYRTSSGELDDAQFSQALAFADAAVAVLLHLQDRAGQAAEAGTEVVRSVDRRAAVHQATGMISVQLDVSLAAAMSRLRAHAFAAGRPILDVAADVVARRLSFDHSDTGTSATPPHGRAGTTGEEETQ